MPKFIIDQALALRTVVEVEADSYEDFVKKHKNDDYRDAISHAQMEWNVEDEEEELFDGSFDDYDNTILSHTRYMIHRDTNLDRWKEEYKREFLKKKIK